MINTSHIGKTHGLESSMPTQPSRRSDSTSDTSDFGRFLAELVDKIDTASPGGHDVTTGPAEKPAPPKK